MANSLTNKALLEIVAKGFDNLLPNMVFVGGAVTALYVPNLLETAELRYTEDIDCTVKVVSQKDYYSLENALRTKGFANEPTLLNRWNYKGITVDILPDNEAILGYTNQWYSIGIQTAESVSISASTTIKIFSYPYFFASKLTALFNRGINDLRLSKDFEDLVFTLFYNPNAIEIISNAAVNVKQFIATHCNQLLNNPFINEAIYSVLPDGELFEENIITIKLLIATMAKL